MVHSLTHYLGHLAHLPQRGSRLKALRHLLIRRPLGRVMQLWRDTRVLSGETLRMLSRQRVKVIAGLGLVVVSCLFLISPQDGPWLAALKAGQPGVVGKAARAISYWGDFLSFNLTVVLILFALSLLLRSRFLRLMVVASLLGTTFTGGTANVCRALLGRARPSAKVEPGFYGPSLSAQLHSCPSGHTATAFGGSIPIAVAMPPLGIPLMIAATSIAWSRMRNHAHHPTDIVLSCAIAAVWGIPLGLLARRMRRHRALRLQKYASLSARRSTRPGAEIAPAAAPLSSSCGLH